MQSATRGVFYLLSFVLLLYGVIDALEQYKAGEEISWSIPIILIGFGSGIPLVLYFSPDMFHVENSADSEFAISESDDGGSGGGYDT